MDQEGEGGSGVGVEGVELRAALFLVHVLEYGGRPDYAGALRAGSLPGTRIAPQASSRVSTRQYSPSWQKDTGVAEVLATAW